MNTLQSKQKAFTQALRDPQNNPQVTGIESARLKVYQSLVFDNHASILQSAFPVVYQITQDTLWDALCRGFLKDYRASSPLFHDIPKAFLDYLQQTKCWHTPYPFLYQLAHYEWLELALEIDNSDIDWQGIHADGDVLAGVPVVSPYAWPCQYDYAVHEIDCDHLPQTAQDEKTYLLLYRDFEDHVQFMKMSPMSCQLLTLMRDTQQSSEALLQQLSGDNRTLYRAGAALVTQWHQQGILLGTKK